MRNFLFLLLLAPEALLAATTATERRDQQRRLPANHRAEHSEGGRRGTRRTPMTFGANRGPITFGTAEDASQPISKPIYEYVDNSVTQIRYSDNYIPERYPGDEPVHPYQQYVLPDTAQDVYQRDRIRSGSLQAAANQAPPGSIQSERQPAPITQVVEGDGSGLGANGVGLGLNAKPKQVPPPYAGAIRNRDPVFKPSPYLGGDVVRQGAGVGANLRYGPNQALIPSVPKEIRVGNAINADVADARPRVHLFTPASSAAGHGKTSVASPGQLALAAAVQSHGQQTASTSQYQYETVEEVDDGHEDVGDGQEREGYGGNQVSQGGQGGQRLTLAQADPAQVGIGSPSEVGSFGQSALGQLGIGNAGVSGLYGAGYEEFLKTHGSSGVLESLGIGHRTNPLFAALLLNNIIISNQKGKPPNALNYGEANQHYLGMMLKQYGKYLPYGLGSYGLYGYSASNNLHNSKAFGQYKHEHAA